MAKKTLWLSRDSLKHERGCWKGNIWGLHYTEGTKPTCRDGKFHAAQIWIRGKAAAKRLGINEHTCKPGEYVEIELGQMKVKK